MSKKIYLFSTTPYLDTIHINSLNTRFFTPNIDFSKYDYLIISSKQVAKALEQYDIKAYIDKPALCVSEQTAKSFEVLGGEVLERGEGYSDTFIKLITKYPKEAKWLYLRAKETASDFVNQIRELDYFIDEAIVYETSCSQEILDVQIENDAVLIFTSPSSVKCFLQTHQLSEQNSLVTIGKTTAKALPNGMKYKTASLQSIESCVELARKLADLK
ncbi:uroporphyrinogen-III synthase [Sulfurimonas sp.]|uniref:uroporphyrinogen-III synthase n=1 Tax=Sulfurimonas sp. TaxID=2022749 RepID=UPI003D12DDA3